MKRSNLLAIFAVAVACMSFAQGAMAATVTGTVVSKTSDTIVISTPNGQETYHVMGANVFPAGMDVGSRVTVTYMPSTAGGQPHADTIVMATATAPGMTGTTTTTTVDASRDYTTTRTSAHDDDEDLPDTAGPVPVLTALGLAAVAGGLALRRISRRSNPRQS